MTNTKHTPAPWHITPGRQPVITIEFDGTAEHTPCQVATIYPEDDNTAAVVMAEANARLIAAAPELLEAVRLLLAYPRPDTTMAATYGADAATARDELWRSAQNTARAAIAKAVPG